MIRKKTADCIVSTLQQTLQTGLTALNLSLDEAQQQHCLNYLQLLLKWNQAYNLTAIRNPEEALILHLLDSATILPYIQGDRIIDVGTGGGLPGILIAIAHPEKTVHLLDTNGKKCRFLNQVKIELKLDNVAVIHSRVEQYNPDQPYDCVTSRSFSSLTNIINWCQHLVAPKGMLLAMKGDIDPSELQAAELLCEQIKVTTLTLPLRKRARHMVHICPKACLP